MTRKEIKKEIKKIIETAIITAYHKTHGREFYGMVVVEKPKEKLHGDYSTNVALVLAKSLKKNPVEVAQKIKDIIDKKYFKKVEVVGGFINFFLKDEIFGENVKQILKEKDNFGKNNSLKSKKVIIEYTDPNPFKKFHIGHLMPNTIGESLARVFEFQGASIKRVNYQGDVGVHVAKAVWAIKQGIDLQEAYAYGHKAYEENEIQKQEILDINKKIYERSDKEINKLYDQGRKQSLAYFETVYEKLGTKFDHYFFESEVADIGKKIVLEGLKKGIFEKGEKDAVIFKGEHTRVFISSEGLATYEAKDLALPGLKYKYFKYDMSVIVTANEQNAYFNVMLDALSKMSPDLAKKTGHIGHGLLRLPSGKMSSRTGTIVPVEDFIKQVEKHIKEKIGERNLADEDMEKIAIGAIRYSILKQSIGSDIIYDANKSVSFEGDSGPYLQYSYARAISILKRAATERIKPSFKNVPREVSQLEKDMYYFPEIVEKSGKELEPHVVSLYLTELAREFNNYYANSKIVDKEDELSPYKVALTKAFSIIMKNGLWLLGINTLERM